VFIDRLTTRNINTAEEVYKILEIGAWKRSTASTRINTQSSRSHSVFTLMLQSKMEKEGITQIQESKLNLVDLAGYYSDIHKNNNNRIKYLNNNQKYLIIIIIIINIIII